MTTSADPVRPRVQAVSFDFGQTLVSLDTGLLTEKLEGLGHTLSEDAIEAALTEAWRAYDRAIAAGEGGHPWKPFMRQLLTGASRRGELGPSDVERATDYLFDDQPRQNLWRRPIRGMIELCRELRACGVAIGVLSNSEGGLVQLVDEMGLTGVFDVLGDSGRLGIEKPDPRIFSWMSKELDAPPETIVHVGDSFGADIEGAVRAGMQAVWFSAPEVGGRASADRLDPAWGVSICESAEDFRRDLIARGARLPIAGDVAPTSITGLR